MVVSTCVYIVTVANGRRYIGVTRNLDRRMVHHVTYRTLVGRAMKKHGWSVQMTFQGTDAECFAEEIRLIAELQTRHPRGYNLTDGGEGVLNPDPKTRQRTAAQHRQWWSVESNRDAAREKMSEARNRESYRRNLSDAMKRSWAQRKELTI